MDVTTVFLALPIFFLIYQGIGLFMESRTDQQWGVAAPARSTFSANKAIREFAGLSAKLGFNKVLLRNKSLHDRLDLLLIRSGHPFGWKAEDLLLCKEISVIFVLLLFIRMGLDPIFWIFGMLVGFWLPDFYMQAKVTARQSSIQRQLPGFIDLSTLALESGLDLMAAIDRILEKMKPGGLKEELQGLLQEYRLGTPRKEALEHLAFRVPLSDVQSMTSIIIQSEELGTGLAGVLRSYAEDMRMRRVLRAEELAGKMPVKLLFPMMVFFFPIVFVIIFGPLALNFMTSYK